MLTSEASVWHVTDEYLRIYVNLARSLGCDCNVEHQAKDDDMNVTINRLVDVKGKGVITWEDKPPVVFGEHCTWLGLQSILGSLTLCTTGERGLPAIILELSLFMIARGTKWGVIHDVCVSIPLEPFVDKVQHSDSPKHNDNNYKDIQDVKNPPDIKSGLRTNLKLDLLKTNSVTVDFPALSERVTIHMSRRPPLINA